MPDNIDWDGLIAEVLQRGTDVPEVPWFKPGEDAAYDVSSAELPCCQTHLPDRGSRSTEGLILGRVQMVLARVQTGCFVLCLLVSLWRSCAVQLCWQIKLPS